MSIGFTELYVYMYFSLIHCIFAWVQLHVFCFVLFLTVHYVIPQIPKHYLLT